MPHKGYRQTPEHVAARVARQVGRTRGAMSEEQKSKLRSAMTGRTLTPEHRAKVIRTLRPDANLGNRGYHHPVEVRDRIAAGQAGKRKPSPEAMERIRAAAVGNHYVQDAVVIGECVYCFAPATTQDHQIPRGRPGWRAPANRVPACFPCNRAKGNRTPEEWIANG